MTGQQIIDQVFTRLGPLASRVEEVNLETDRVLVLQVEATLALAQAVVDLTDLIKTVGLDTSGRLRVVSVDG